MTSRRTTSPEPIPHIATAVDIYSGPDELRDRWRALLGPLGFSEPLLWFTFVDPPGCLLPAINQLPIPGPPDPDLVDLLVDRLVEIVDGEDTVRVAFLLSRPGADGTRPWDRGWVRLLTAAARRSGLAIEPVFRADDVEVAAVPVDPGALEAA